MSVNGKRADITREDLLTVGKAMNIKKAEGILEEVLAGVNGWKKYAEEAGAAADQAKAIGGMHQGAL
jgi:serine/threonine-protein kinase HipA